MMKLVMIIQNATEMMKLLMIIQSATEMMKLVEDNSECDRNEMKLVMIIQNATTLREDFSEAPRLYTPSSLKLQTLNLRAILIIYHREQVFVGWCGIYLCNMVFVCSCVCLVKGSY